MILLSTVLMHSWNLTVLDINILYKYSSDAYIFLCVWKMTNLIFVCDAETSSLRQMAGFILPSHRAAEKSSLFSWWTAAALLCPLHNRPETEALWKQEHSTYNQTISLTFHALSCSYIRWKVNFLDTYRQLKYILNFTNLAWLKDMFLI